MHGTEFKTSEEILTFYNATFVGLGYLEIRMDCPCKLSLRQPANVRNVKNDSH